MQAAAEADLFQHELSRRAVLRRWRFGAPVAYAANAHDGVEIAWCGAGRLEYGIAGRTHALVPGAAIVIPADAEHVTRVAEPGTYAASVHVTRDAFAAAADAMRSRLGDAHVAGGSVERPSTLATLGALLAREAEGDAAQRGASDAARAMLVDALTDAVVVEALRGGARTATAAAACDERDGAPDARIRRAVALIHERYADALTIDDLADAACVSRFHFGRLFRAATGKTPYRYLLDVRMARAAELLRTRRCPVTEAALSVGCNDLGRFGRMFRETFGVRPSEYLRAASHAV